MQQQRHASLLAALAFGLLLLANALPASAQEANSGYTFTYTPSHGNPGTVISVAGTGCHYEGKPYEYAKVYLFRRENNGEVTGEAQARYVIADDGSFSGDLTVPEHARPGKDLLTAECYASDMAFVVADSDFTVDGPVPTPTRSPSPRPSPTPTSTPPPKPTPQHSPSRSPSAMPSASRPTLSITTPPVTASSVLTSPRRSATVGPIRDTRTSHGTAIAVAILLLVVDIAGLLSFRRRQTG